MGKRDLLLEGEWEEYTKGMYVIRTNGGSSGSDTDREISVMREPLNNNKVSALIHVGKKRPWTEVCFPHSPE